MSYDYLLFPRPPISVVGIVTFVFARKIGKALAMMRSMEGPPIGELADVKAKISTTLSGINWEKIDIPAELALPIPGHFDWTWCSIGVPEIKLGIDSNNNIRLVSVSRAEPREVKALAKALKLSIADEQALE